MMLIGKTANWLLRHSVQRCVKNRRLVCAHARNHAICLSCPKISHSIHSCRTLVPQKIAESLCAEGREITHAQN